MSTEDRDTVPALPVPSTNPTADLRRALDESNVALRRAYFAGESTFFGMKLIDDVFEDMTPRLVEATAQEWLRRAKSAITHGTMVPQFCVNGHLQVTPGLCGTCLRGGQR